MNCSVEIPQEPCHCLISTFALLLLTLVPPPINLPSWNTPGTALWTTRSGGVKGSPKGVDYGQHTHQALIQPPSFRHLGLLYATTFHTLALPSASCLLPPGTPAFLSASGSHKSSNPPALLTVVPLREREGEKEK